jgi:hypothetical protein
MCSCFGAKRAEWSSHPPDVRLKRRHAPSWQIWMRPMKSGCCRSADGRGRVSTAQKSTSASISFEPRDAARRSFASGPPIRQRCEKRGEGPSLVCGQWPHAFAARIELIELIAELAPSLAWAIRRDRGRPHLASRACPTLEPRAPRRPRAGPPVGLVRRSGRISQGEQTVVMDPVARTTPARPALSGCLRQSQSPR